MTDEVKQTLIEISTLVDTLATQCALLNKDEHKEELIKIKQQIRKLESKLITILPDTKVPIGSNGQSGDKVDRLKARAARFGCENDEIKKVTESEKLSKRKERFNAEDKTEDAKKQRLARFGQ